MGSCGAQQSHTHTQKTEQASKCARAHKNGMNREGRGLYFTDKWASGHQTRKASDSAVSSGPSLVHPPLTANLGLKLPAQHTGAGRGGAGRRWVAVKTSATSPQLRDLRKTEYCGQSRRFPSPRRSNRHNELCHHFAHLLTH